MKKQNDYDLAIVGCGPAGMAAGIYAGRLGLRTIIFGIPHNSAMAKATLIENYPGFERITGAELTKRMLSHTKKWCTLLCKNVTALTKATHWYEMTTADGKKYTARAIIIATGSKHRELGIKGERDFFGKGVSYCASCDARLYKGKEVAVIGGGNVALTSALCLSAIVKKVYLIHRRTEFRGEASWVSRVRAAKNIELVLGFVPEEIYGTEVVEGIRLRAVATKDTKDIKVSGVFICVGEIPATTLAEKLGVRIKESAIVVDENQATNIRGIFAAGDVTGPPFTIVKAVSQGARAALAAFDYLKNNASFGALRHLRS